MHDSSSTNNVFKGPGIKFTKYHGNGNDFIIFDCLKNPTKPKSSIAQKICDRHLGVGADGVIFLTDQEPFNMSLYNADGTLAHNCGNGLRVVADYLFNKTGLSKVSIHFSGRDYSCQRRDSLISVEMGQAQIRRLPDFKAHSVTAKAAKVFMGNEHLVLFFDCEEDAKVIKEKVSFANEKENIGFLWEKPNGTLCSEVYERGVGFTNSCGTGACAAAMFKSLLSQKKSMVIEQLGGKIEVDAARLKAEGDVHVFLITQTGEAEAVFFGYLPSAHELVGPHNSLEF